MSRPLQPDRPEIPPEAGSGSDSPATSGGMIDPRIIHPSPEELFPEAGDPLPEEEAGDSDSSADPEKPVREVTEGPKLLDPRDTPGEIASGQPMDG